ncbi:MAG: S-formylglutathione hydrolase [Betaproteobacteria bacterium]
MRIDTISRAKCFGGIQGVYSHESTETHCTMRFGLYLPPAAERGPVPLLYWLSGLTCTEENFITKAGAQRVAAELGLAIAVPDTSPRGVVLPGDQDSYDLGVGAGFYVDATQSPWAGAYRMYSYVTLELPRLLAANFPVDDARVGIFGHSMGGHGALTIALRNPRHYRSVSAFAPICSAAHSPWGEKAFTHYLGADRASWQDYDASALVETRGWSGPPILVDQGSADQFLEEQLKPALLATACQRAGVPLRLRMHDGYDHSYHFIATFIEDHLKFHAANVA